MTTTGMDITTSPTLMVIDNIVLIAIVAGYLIGCSIIMDNYQLGLLKPRKS